MVRETIYLGNLQYQKYLISLSKFRSLDFTLTLKKGVFSKLFKQSSTKSFHIIGPLIEVMCLVLISFKLDFEKFKVDGLEE